MDPLRTSPGLDLKRAFPQRDITTWHLVLRDLELDKEPHSTVALCDCVARIGDAGSCARTLDPEIGHFGCEAKQSFTTSRTEGRGMLCHTKGAWRCLRRLWQLQMVRK